MTCNDPADAPKGKVIATGKVTTYGDRSEYQLVIDRYPTKPDAATALYRRGRMLLDAGKKDEARVLFNRILKDFPRSDEALLVKDLVKP